MHKRAIYGSRVLKESKESETTFFFFQKKQSPRTQPKYPDKNTESSGHPVDLVRATTLQILRSGIYIMNKETSRCYFSYRKNKIRSQAKLEERWL